MTRKFRYRSPVVDAIQFNSKMAAVGNRDIFLYLGGEVRWKKDLRQGGYIRAVQGDLPFAPGDWIVKDAEGRIFPVDHETFLKLYEPLP